MAFWDGGGFPAYVSVAERRAQAAQRRTQLEKKGRKLDPVVIEGRAIASTPWGKAWCAHIEGCGDYVNRLPRGRTYARNGSVFDLQIRTGELTALVSGSEVYALSVRVAALPRARWTSIKSECSGKIGSVLELLTGRLSTGVMEVLCHPDRGLFPAARELTLSCSCPDGAWLCKHLAAVLYGVGARLDRSPELLFVLRGVDSTELITAASGANVLRGGASNDALSADALSELFGIELAQEPEPATRPGTSPGAKSAKRSARASAKAPARPSAKASAKASVPPARRQKPGAIEGKSAVPGGGAPARKKRAAKTGRAARPAR